MITIEYYKKNNDVFVESDLNTIINEIIAEGKTNIIIRNIRIESGLISLREDYTMIEGNEVNMKNIVPDTYEHVLKGSTFSCGLDRDSLAQQYMSAHPELFIGKEYTFSLIGDGSGSIKRNDTNEVVYWTHGKCGTMSSFLPPCNPFPGQGSKHCPIADQYIPENKYFYGIILKDFSHWFCPHRIYTPIFRKEQKFCLSGINNFSRYVITNKNGYLCKEGTNTLPVKTPVWSDTENNIVYEQSEYGNDKKYYYNQPAPVTPGTLYLNYNDYLIKVIFDYSGEGNESKYYYWIELLKSVMRTISEQSKNIGLNVWYEVPEEQNFYFDMNDSTMEIQEVWNSNFESWERYTLHQNRLYWTNFPYSNWSDVFGGLPGEALTQCEYDAKEIDMTCACMTLNSVEKKCSCGVSTIRCETLQQTSSIKDYEEIPDDPFKVWEV